MDMEIDGLIDDFTMEDLPATTEHSVILSEEQERSADLSIAEIEEDHSLDHEVYLQAAEDVPEKEESVPFLEE